MVSLKRTGGKGTGNTPHAQQDICGISPVICSPAGVASIICFLNRLVNPNEGHIAVTQFVRGNQDFTQTSCLFLYNMSQCHYHCYMIYIGVVTYVT